ncbi:MAG: hypothetical protein A2445_03060 [Candidatus Jacksonbacteria bacterium RIFOXYC2_FULL_44_29]|nr:MAG: hypothetical protein A2240_04070 [Candidatus Jacksonbacteria bacterium RIFOXYA2_FULL_43_12]OGY76170.1 MAG: hypothetical protein A2295_03530 [Candidatus Jacksonbacteria bacterium RIFOXYB2_FULL_44_15]OGY80076.1 MAG: hypothetical protein A2445_03060 [Candidatus Jacksonbacteria bacterium RIFOXYC2_FULL_44_29]OGY81735.1 MAG: hypothetical protein A2550_01030 [Candidatus Jacksonbacteria bacterium RIFOXYD2_FULL_43_21]HBH46835.1 hypothetical protein [Candidatus Jacksonbacteria bacterium]
MLTVRQDNLLRAIISEYVKTAEPVGSQVLVEKYKLDVSSATVRNEMLELDELGYLEQPHTSAGRIPTEAGYRYFLDNQFISKKPSFAQEKKLSQTIREGQGDRQSAKALAKILAELSQEFILTAFTDNDFYYTGLTNLFIQPEFSNQHIVYNIAGVIDQLDRHLAKLYHQVNDEIVILVGTNNPIDPALSLITVKTSGNLLIAILGPLRMPYRTNVGLLEYSRELMKNLS